MSKAFYQWMSGVRDHFAQMADERKKLHLMEEVNRRIQVKEFDNILCLSVDGVPVIPMGNFNKQMLSDARLTLYNYLNAKR